MEKRDLKADLEQVRNFRSRLRQSISPEEDWKIGVVLEDFCRDKAELWLDQALAEKERADKAEALVRELVGVIDDLCRQINQCGLDEQMWEVYRTAKEVLGNDRTELAMS
jgi:predicted nucleotidyltransferase